MRTLADVRAFIAGEARRLDPGSRYVRELHAVVDTSSDVDDLERRLMAGCRGSYWAGAETFARMSLAQKLLVNLVTNETSLMRFEVEEMAFLRARILPFLEDLAHDARVLSLPCSHGEEPVSLAIEMLEGGDRGFSVQGFDIQPACVETARSGRIPLSGLPRYVVGLVDPIVMAHLRFDVADAFVADLGGPYDLVVCRNFLGYFVADSVRAILDRLLAVLAPEAFLLVDRFAVEKLATIFASLPLARAPGLPVFSRGVR